MNDKHVWLIVSEMNIKKQAKNMYGNNWKLFVKHVGRCSSVRYLKLYNRVYETNY